MLEIRYRDNQCGQRQRPQDRGYEDAVALDAYFAPSIGVHPPEKEVG